MNDSMVAVLFAAAFASACAKSVEPEDVKSDASSKGGGSSGKGGSVGSLDSGNTDGWAPSTGGSCAADAENGTGGIRGPGGTRGVSAESSVLGPPNRACR